MIGDRDDSHPAGGGPPAPSAPPPTSDLATETLRSLFASWRLLMGRRNDALALLNLSEAGFWRSFAAFAVALPIDLLAVRLGLPAAATDAQRAIVGAVLFRAAATLALEWVLWLLAAAVFARLLGLAANYGRYVIVYNWSTPLVLAIQVVPAALWAFGLINREAAAFFFLFLLGIALYLRWQNARVGLLASPPAAFGLVLADFLLSLLILKVLDSI